MAKKMLITAETWERVLDEVSKETDRLMTKPPENQSHGRAFLLFVDTLKATTDLAFDYLPPAERTTISAFCATWMNVGILFGMCPQALVDILVRTEAKGITYDEGGDET